MIAELKQALEAVERAGDWTNPRTIVPRALALAGIPAEKVIESANKTVALVGPYAVKSCAPHQVQSFLALADRITIFAAKVHASGRCWMIQERVEPAGPQRAMQRDLAHVGAADIAHNCGTTKAGRIVAFDGHLVPVDH